MVSSDALTVSEHLKSLCLHFKKVDDRALDFLAKTIAQTNPDELIARCEQGRGRRR